MPFTLFTIIQADDDSLGPAADYLERTFRTNRPQQAPALMARETTRRRSSADAETNSSDTLYEDKDNAQSRRSASHADDQSLPLRTLRPDMTLADNGRPISWSDSARVSAHRQSAARSRSPQAVRTYVPSRSMNSTLR